MAFFRNLTLFRFPTATDFSEVDQLLPAVVLKPVGPLEMNSRGFMSPFGREEQVTLSHRLGDFLWLTVGGEDKILPAAVVNDALARKISEIEAKEGRKPGGRERKRIKDDLIHELLPRAFVKSSRTDAVLDLRNGYIAVDTSSRKTAESVMSQIRGLLGSFPAMPLNAEVAPRGVLTGWIAGEPLPEGLSLGEECEMKDPVEGGATVRCSAQELRSDEIDRHLDAGKQVTKLAMVLDDHLSFVAGDDLVIRKLKFLDGALDQLEEADQDGLRAEFDARFALMSGELRRLFSVLETAFKLSAAEA
ncbi:recombination-associated protein RdgC [Xanthomonas axonopodis]|uniref:Recombination-associated protein RdgC n=1 Tax=Xanthomonas axonopodis pv. vasculorum TaxID=325777 RepID=A0A098PUK8_9XANT|nr:recombination-associated protein RdgC [Xanthomonas axonopodis]KGE50376.1 recombinase RdgC [Xanthomonas axonopodis pv. vasculorum]